MVDSFVKVLERDFKAKSDSARTSIIRRFLHIHRYFSIALRLNFYRCEFRFGIRAGTHVAQTNPEECIQLASDFMQSIRPRLIAQPEQRLILNMDQTPVFFSMHPRTTLNRIGDRTVNIRASSSSTLRITVAFTITAAGTKLKPMVIFKGKTSGRIAREFGRYVQGPVYACQDNAWMDEKMMLMWIETVCPVYLYCNIVSDFWLGIEALRRLHQQIPTRGIAAGFIPMPHDGLGCFQNPGSRCGSSSHPWWLHWACTAGGRWHR